jgi:hypothetical protein
LFTDVSGQFIRPIFKVKLSRPLHFFPEKVKVKFTLEQAMKAQRGIRGIALLFL